MWCQRTREAAGCIFDTGDFELHVKWVSVMNQIYLSPSLMCIPAWQSPEKKIAEIEACGVSLMHVDVMDGMFVPNLMLGTENIKSLRQVCHVPLDIHLMIDKPEDKLGWFDIQPGDYVSIHQESTRHLQRALAIVRNKGGRPSVAINPATPLCMIENVLPDVDMVLIMTVNPGFAGQALVPQTLKKVAALRDILDKNGMQHVRIEVDGNVSFENAPKMRAAGADVFVCGTSSIFHKSGTVESNAAKLMALMTAVEQEVRNEH